MDEEYVREVSKQAIVATAAALGIKNVQEDCLDILQDILRQSIHTLGSRAMRHVEITERSAPGIQDVISTLDTLTPFRLNWKVLRDFGLGGNTADNEGTNQSKWCQPFPVPDMEFFPLEKPIPIANNSEYSSLEYEGNNRSSNKYGQDKFIPSYLPAYPPAHTYRSNSSSSSSTLAGGAAGHNRSKKRPIAEEDSAMQHQKMKKQAVLVNRSAIETLMALENA